MIVLAFNIIAFSYLLFSGNGSVAPSIQAWQPCMPANINIIDIVSIERAPDGRELKRITVEQRLRQLRAHCRKGKLVSSNKKEIRFYRLVGCWGNPPADYSQILGRQRREVEELKKRYALIEIPCNPEGRRSQ